MFKIAICDDNTQDRKLIRQMIEEKLIAPDRFSIDEYDSGKRLLSDANKQHDLIIIDICMKNMDGNETAKNIRQTNEAAVLAFYSGTAAPTTESFKVRAYRYIMKNQAYALIEKDVEDLLNEMKRCAQKCFIMVQVKETTYMINSEDILYISKKKRGSEVVVTKRMEDRLGNPLHSKEHVNDLYGRLKSFGFEPAHDSYIINMNHIQSIRDDNVILSGGWELHIARSRRFGFKNALSSFLGCKY